MMNISATQKAGSEKPTMLAPMMRRDRGCCGFMPANRPSGTPITTASNSAATASSIVAGRRCRIRRIASSW